MDIATNATEQKLLQALGQFKRARWHDQTVGGCKPSEIRALFCIKHGSTADAPMKVSDISKQLHVTSPTITQLLKGLEASKLVERHNDPTDRRTIGISLTEKGNYVAQMASDSFSESLHGLMNYLGEEQSNELADLLFKVYSYFEEHAAKHAHNDYWNGEYKA